MVVPLKRNAAQTGARTAFKRMMKHCSALVSIASASVLSGCKFVVMAPSGDIAQQQADLIIVSTMLMLLIIVPVLFLTFYFAWHFRQSNPKARYDPEWHHSTRLEVVIWSAPLAIIIALGTITWISTHKLDPYRPLDRIDPERPVSTDVRPLEVEVVALDWKWLFFYPEYGIATVNEMAAPIDRPITFKISASSVMNSFYIPALAGQIYAMPGMETKMHAVINHEGVFDGLSANYSGAGFSHMRFKFYGLRQEGFDDWIARVKQNGTALNRDTYLKLEKPSEREPVRYYAKVEEDLYQKILNLCVRSGRMCLNEMMQIDMMGGAGTESTENRERLKYDDRHADYYGGHGSGLGDTVPASGLPARSDTPPHEADEPSDPTSGNSSSNDDPAPDQFNNN